MNGDHRRTRIILARHGEAAYPSPATEETRGGILTELGQEQARALAARIRDERVTAVVSSELSRARETARIVAHELGLEVEARPGLHEYEQGDEPFDVLSVGRTLLGWLAGDLDARILGGESGREILWRIMPVLDDLARSHAGDTVLVVIHGGAIIATLGGVAPGRTGLPSDGNPYRLDSDLVGGSSFRLEHEEGSWRMLPPGAPTITI